MQMQSLDGKQIVLIYLVTDKSEILEIKSLMLNYDDLRDLQVCHLSNLKSQHLNFYGENIIFKGFMLMEVLVKEKHWSV